MHRRCKGYTTAVTAVCHASQGSAGGHSAVQLNIYYETYKPQGQLTKPAVAAAELHTTTTPPHPTAAGACSQLGGICVCVVRRALPSGV
jgi:hypothetical protein